ncbi:hypothetical protein QTP88_024369 [Uroleucon formosanum]
MYSAGVIKRLFEILNKQVEEAMIIKDEQKLKIAIKQHQELLKYFRKMETVYEKQILISIEFCGVFIGLTCFILIQVIQVSAKIIEELAELWPECKIVHGRPRHPQSQGSVERSNQDVENMLRAWVVDNKSRSPYRALFGTEPKVGLSSTNLPAEIIQKLSSEEDFENILQDISEHNFDNIPSKKKKYCDINNICSVCEKSGSELQCTICKRNIHSDNCSYSINNSNDIENICLLCNNEKQIKVNRIESYKRQTIAAKKMAENSEKLFKELKVGDQIVLSVPKVDRGPLDSQNINGLVIDIRNGVYQIGTEVEDSKIQKDKFVSIREAVANLSIFNGQGFVKCQCQSRKRQCQTNRCLCFKKNLKCSSKCHQISTCDNK